MTDETVWHEPDIRCEWWRYTGAAPCPNQAIVVLVLDDRWPDGGRVIRRFAACEHHWCRDEHMYSWSEYIVRDPRPMSLLCGAFASAWDTRLRALLDAGDPSVLLDCTEERGLHEPPVERDGVLVGPWPVDERGDPVRRQEWLEVTGRHEHTWLKWRSGDKERATSACMIPGDLDWIRRCTCGVFEHEQPVARWSDELRGDIPDRCGDPGCQREAGHPPPHRARIHLGHGHLGEEEWGDPPHVDAADITQRYLDGDPHVLD